MFKKRYGLILIAFACVAVEAESPTIWTKPRYNTTTTTTTTEIVYTVPNKTITGPTTTTYPTDTTIILTPSWRPPTSTNPPILPRKCCGRNEVYLQKGAAPNCDLDCDNIEKKCNIIYVQAPSGCYCSPGYCRSKGFCISFYNAGIKCKRQPSPFFKLTEN